MKKNILNSFFLLLSTLIIGCSDQFVRIESSSILNVTKLDTLTKDEQDRVVALNRSTEKINIFNNAKALSVNGYRILFTGEADGIIYVAKDKTMIASIESGKNATSPVVSVYKPHAGAPVEGTERAIVTNSYVAYSGETYVFEDYGLDGLDVKYEFSASDKAESFLNGQKCEKTIVAGVACCKDEAGKLNGFRFTPQKGWELSTNERIKAHCEKKP